MNHTVHQRQQQAILDRVVSILRSSDHVLGVLLVGSFSRGDNDAFSDIDVWCYLRDEQRTGREELYDSVAAIHPLLCQLWIYDTNALYLFQNGVRLDLDFLRPSDLQDATRAFSDAKIVYDPDGILPKHIEQIRAERPARHPPWFEPGSQAFLEWFFWMFRQIVCWSLRARQGGYRSFDKLSNAVDSIAEVRTRLKEMRLWTNGRQDYLLRVDPRCAANLSAAFPHLDSIEVIECAKRLLDEYERIGPEYCRKAGVAFPAEKARITRSLIGDFEKTL